MRIFIPILFLFLALLALQVGFIHPEQANPTQEAITFIKDIQSGNLTKIVAHFGGNTCRCPARNGWGGYLAYQTGQEANLAFMLGHPFSIGQPVAKRIESPPQAKYAAPFEQPEDYMIDVPLTFNRNQYSPFFLPLPMAYGKKMTWQEVQDFIKDPAHEAIKGFSLRLRHGLAPGAIKFDTSTIAATALGEFKFLKPAKSKDREYSEKIKAILANSMKSSDNQFVTPQDAGPVIMPDDSTLAIQKLAEILPRLQSANMRLHVVRRGKMQPWTIFHFVILNPVVEENNGARVIPLS